MSRERGLALMSTALGEPFGDITDQGAVMLLNDHLGTYVMACVDASDADPLVTVMGTLEHTGQPFEYRIVHQPHLDEGAEDAGYLVVRVPETDVEVERYERGLVLRYPDLALVWLKDGLREPGGATLSLFFVPEAWQRAIDDTGDDAPSPTSPQAPEQEL